MGIVYRARDLQLDREVALKRPHLELLNRPDFHSRFLGEARASSKLMHPNITTVFEVFEEDGVPWMAMELIDGASLRSLLSGHRPLPLETVLQHAEGLVDALRAAHTSGILHRDIKPNNILVGRDGRARLSDFGLARARIELEEQGWESGRSTVTDPAGGIAGTRGYMSPEQALGKTVDPRSDIFSMGLVLYEMCTGEPVFPRPSDPDWIDALLHREPPPIGDLNGDVPPELQDIVHKAISKRRFQRYQSANEMLLDIRALRRRIHSDSDLTRSGLRKPRGRRMVYAAAGAVALVIGAVAGWKHFVKPHEPEAILLPTHHRLTAAPGWEGEPALSPDGSMVAYTSDESGSRDIWVVHSAGGQALRLTDHPGSDTDPAWFPDGTTIAVVSNRGGEPAVWRVPSLGGDPVMLLPKARDPAISPDGEHIAFVRPGPSGALRIWVAPLDDPTTGRALTGDGDGVWRHTDPAWSPDGTTLCYADFGDLWLVAVDGGSPRRLTMDGETSRQPVWSADGRHIYFSSRRDGTLALWRIAVADGESERVTVGTGGEGDPSLDRESNHLAYGTSDVNTDIVIRDIASGQEFKIAGSTIESEPAVSPDGSIIAFMSDRLGSFDLWLQSLKDGRLEGRPRQLTDQRGMAALPSFSPDGRWIAYHRAIEGERDIWIIPVTGGDARRFTEHPAVDIQPSYSPDGSQIAFVSERDGTFQIWVAPVADGLRIGEPRRLTSGDAVHNFPAWSPDGRRIACVCQTQSGHEVGVFDVDSDAPPDPVTLGADAVRVLWTDSGDELLVSGTWGSDRYSLRTVSLNGDRVVAEQDIDLGPDDQLGGLFAVGGGGSLLTYVATEKTGDVWLAEINRGRR